MGKEGKGKGVHGRGTAMSALRAQQSATRRPAVRLTLYDMHDSACRHHVMLKRLSTVQHDGTSPDPSGF